MDELNYRAAVFLNNTGCSLMEQGSYLQALETFQDAVFLMKFASRLPVGDSLPSSESGAHRDIHSMTQRAAQHLSKPMVEDTLRDVHAIPDDAVASEMDVALHRSPFQGKCAFPIRFDDFDPCFADKDASITCTIIILHNFGLSCLCRARCLPSDQAARLFDNAVRILNLCQSVLSCRSMNCTDHLQLKRLFFLGYVVMLTLIQAYLEAGETTIAIECVSKLERLRAGVRELGRADALVSRHTLAAAA